jgi:hypothetical protein
MKALRPFALEYPSKARFVPGGLVDEDVAY